MSDLIVVAGATHREGFINEYEQQLAFAGIEFYLAPLEKLPLGANSITMRRRVSYIREICQKFSDRKFIVMTDAWDVLFYGTKGELISKIPATMIVSGERNCYPEPELSSRFNSTSPWRFANNGMIAGSPAYILDWLEWAEQMPDIDLLDQAWFNRRLVDDPNCIAIDETTALFYVMSATQEDGALRMKDGRPWNSRYDTSPCFFHFSGKCPDDRFRALMKGELTAI
jgi:hypothetical protein